VLHSRWQDAERKWLIESSGTQGEYSRLAAEAADEAVWAATSAEAVRDNERAAIAIADEEMQRAIELSLQSDPDLQLAIQLSLDDAHAAAAAPDD
jgi:transcription initiation factor IIF auxiliary subunit